MTDAAFTATFANVKNVPSRKCVQFVFEVPVEQAKAANDILGGFPDPSVSIHVAIARLKDTPAPKPKRERLTSERAAMLCRDQQFGFWLGGCAAGHQPMSEDAIATWLRNSLGIKSRAELDTDPEARKRFEILENEFNQSTGRMAHVR